jgi:hypothetical protein
MGKGEEMILNIKITDAALAFLKKESAFTYDDEEALEIGQTFISLCDKSASSRDEAIDGKKPIGYRLRRAARDLIKYRREAGINGDLEELDRIHELERALEEGKGSPDRLERAEIIITRFASLRFPGGGVTYPTRSMIDEAIAWIKEGEKKSS